MAKAVYIHIPFCEQICHYCDFNKFLLEGQPVDDYLDAMEEEIRRVTDVHPFDNLSSIYIGGGTPTALNEEQLVRMLNIVRAAFQPDLSKVEYTVEANPAVTDRTKLGLLKNAGVNRLSIGVQAFQDELLKKLNRTHRSADVIKMIEAAHQYGFEDISIDLMFGLPGQTLDMFKESVQQAIQLDVPHISAYSLQVEKQTVFFNRQRKGTLTLPSEDIEADMFQHLIDQMKAHGYRQYEVSNFAREVYESRHNLVYWDNDEYYGIGAGAHGYLSNTRYENVKPLPHYIRKIKNGELPQRERTQMRLNERMEEELFLGLRKMEGVSKTKFHQKFGCRLDELFSEQIDMLEKRNLIINTSETVRLSEQGIFLGNEVFQEFIGVI
ncbi:radical SAM family heme chaperone HemW [Alkalihalobacillus sp. AL-G]|uniref:radical SAM family heme chaperone HemW n=1 Tax=Alkalihalobacillus sp. AL-G TaxID=2926399 RepID=UPI00272A991B|nr:radical SAM family heme chaperone HemW [Alkalihalobacillus sp. AL-G]WLD92139.1 radical SAM family heme chaperone HemW [Alkalihalobacillus sp. AL-G]